MPGVYRVEKINSLIQQILADLIAREFCVSREIIITLTRVETTGNLFEAKVFISVFGGKPQDRAKAFELLREKRGEIQRRISKDVILKYTPVLHFFNDERMEKADKVLQIISGLEVEK